jgi:hypothetical protein
MSSEISGMMLRCQQANPTTQQLRYIMQLCTGASRHGKVHRPSAPTRSLLDDGVDGRFFRRQDWYAFYPRLGGVAAVSRWHLQSQNHENWPMEE